MSTYTTQLRWIVERAQQEHHAEPTDYSPAYPILGLDSYPIFDESYRSTLNDKIIRHFWFREIGFETAGQFAWFLRNTMNEQMPYFNQLYDSLNLITDPITNRKFGWREAYEGHKTGGTTTGREYGDHTTDSTEYGSTLTDGWGKVETMQKTKGTTHEVTTNYGKTVVDTTTHGHVIDETGKTEYGKTQRTENSGKDDVTEGSIHERVIHSDTPMNQITNQGVENLNYASDVTYTDREGTGAATTEYGGIVEVANDGEDNTTGQVKHTGTDENRRVGSGTDRVTSTRTGGDTDTSTLSGQDTHSKAGTDTRSGEGWGSSTERMTRGLDAKSETEHDVSGYDGMSPADLLDRFRKTFINVDMQVISSLEILFMGLW